MRPVSGIAWRISRILWRNQLPARHARHPGVADGDGGRPFGPTFVAVTVSIAVARGSHVAGGLLEPMVCQRTTGKLKIPVQTQPTSHPTEAPFNATTLSLSLIGQ